MRKIKAALFILFLTFFFHGAAVHAAPTDSSLPAPKNVEVKYSGQSTTGGIAVSITWDSVPGASSYHIYTRNDTMPQGTGKLVPPPPNGLINGNEYSVSIDTQHQWYFWINTVNPYGEEGDPSPEVLAPKGPPSSEPQEPQEPQTKVTPVTLDQLKNVFKTDNIAKQSDFSSLGSLVSKAMEVIFLAALFLVFIWSLIGIFQYILAGGNKEGLAKARNRIKWAFLGFVFLLVSFALVQYFKDILPIQEVKIQQIDKPDPIPVTPTQNQQGNQ